MADANKLKDMLSQLAGEGVNFGDILKALKGLKDSGVIRSRGRGKSPLDDPTRVAIRDYVLAGQVNGKSLIEIISGATVDSTSFMVTLNDDWKINFVKNVERPKKPKKDKTVEPEGFAEPAVS